MGFKGDVVELTWEDNQGNKDSLEGEVK